MNMPLSIFMIYIDICMNKGAKLLNNKLRQKTFSCTCVVTQQVNGK